MIGVRALSPLLGARRARGLVIPLGLLLLWSLLGTTPARAFYFVPPTKIAAAMLEVVGTGELFQALQASLRTALFGLLWGGLLGLVAGVALGTSHRFDRLVGPSLHALRQVPLLGLAPLISLWLGNGEAPKTLMVLLAVFFPLLVNSHDGVRALDRRMLEVARVHGLSRTSVLARVVLPGIAPFVFTGLSQAVAFVWLATIGSELLFTASSGLGTMMSMAQAAARMDVVLVCVGTIGVAGLLVNALVRRLGARVMRWRDLGRVSA